MQITQWECSLPALGLYECALSTMYTLQCAFGCKAIDSKGSSSEKEIENPTLKTAGAKTLKVTGPAQLCHLLQPGIQNRPQLL